MNVSPTMSKFDTSLAWFAALGERAAMRVFEEFGAQRIFEHNESSCKLLPTGEVLGSFRDVTRRRQLEDALRHLNEELEYRVAERTAALEAALAESRRLAAIIEAMPDYIGMTDPEGYSLYVNSAGKRMVGKTEVDYPECWHVSIDTAHYRVLS